MKRWILSMLALWTQLFANAQEKIVACEYWVDGEQEKAISIPVSGDEVLFSLDASHLKEGTHTLYYRVQDEQGRYSPPQTWLFIKHYVQDTTLSRIKELEYWLDGDKSTARTMQMESDSVMFTLDASHLKEGVHTLYYRVQNERGQYNSPQMWLFMKHYVQDTTHSRIKELEYWLDGDMSRIQQVDVASDTVSFAVDASDLKPGTHTLTMRVCNEKEAKSAPLMWMFYKDYTRATHISWYKYWWNNHQDKGERVITESKEEEYVFSQQLVVPDYAKVDADTVLKTANFYIQFGNNAGYTTAIDTVKVPITSFSPVDDQGIVYTLNETMDAFEVIGYTDALVADVVIPEKLYSLPVTTMRDEALADAVALNSIVLPASIASVGSGVFGGCSNLLVVDWNTTIPLQAKNFDTPEVHGNLLVFANDRGDFEGNVVTNGVAEEICLIDGLPFRNPREFQAKHICYTRNFAKETRMNDAAGWEGVVLPFDVQRIFHDEKGELAPFGMSDFVSTLPFWLAEWKHEEETFAHILMIKANEPFIMAVPNNDVYDERFNIEGPVTFSAENATVHPTAVDSLPFNVGFSLLNCYEGEVALPYIYALNDEEYMTTDGVTYMPGGVFVSDLRDIRPFEAYMFNAQVIRSRYLPVQGGTAQGIDRLLLKDAEGNGDDSWYTLQGIRLNGKPMQKGMYIHGGKKVMVR